MQQNAVHRSVVAHGNLPVMYLTKNAVLDLSIVHDRRIVAKSLLLSGFRPRRATHLTAHQTTPHQARLPTMMSFSMFDRRFAVHLTQF